MVPLFYQIARCLNSSQFQVAEKALFLWNKEPTLDLIRQNNKVILPIILSALEQNINWHWNQMVQKLSLSLRKLLSDRDPELFAECLRKYEEDKAKEKALKLKQEAAWKRLDEIALAKVIVGEAVLVCPALPRQSSII
ncbi:hypothetical protein QOZ80_7AG0562900 [Eleusine coracana subsp. coracana]|nr:hypothetical protein QOZ80_7AG0562900 [Eleusine coracana subsp. coracana]